MRRKKIKLDFQVENNTTPTRYYWCVNCGRKGNFGKLRVRNLKCSKCDYDDLCPYTKEKIIEDERLSLKDFKLD